MNGKINPDPPPAIENWVFEKTEHTWIRLMLDETRGREQQRRQIGSAELDLELLQTLAHVEQFGDGGC